MYLEKMNAVIEELEKMNNLMRILS